MAFDGVVISSVVYELNQRAIGGRIYKIQQPEVDELCLIIKNNKDTFRLLLSADASLPLLYITEATKDNPITAPNFCMLLRKHIGNGRILSVTQPNFERIVVIEIEHLDEMGDLCRKKLIIEIMGKHSNIIFTDAEDRIIDSIKHISHQVSSVREVLPGRTYVFPPSQDKRSPFDVEEGYFTEQLLAKPVTVTKAIYTSVNGISPVTAGEICVRAGIDGGRPAASLTTQEKQKLYQTFAAFMAAIGQGDYQPCIAYQGRVPKEYSAVLLTMYSDLELRTYDGISQVLEEYYRKKSVESRIRQKSYDLRKIVANAVERTSRKYDLQLAQMKDTEDREKYRIYGELLNTYGYSAAPGDRSLTCVNYYDNQELTIPLDENLSVSENSKKYFAKYNKKKRTYEALSQLLTETKAEMDYLLSVQNSLSIAESEADLAEIKEELMHTGFIKRKGQAGKKGSKKAAGSKPFHYISSDGYHIYVGKNNLQNEELSFQVAKGNDLWFHAKKMPGSHVIVKTEGETELPDSTYEEAARLAAYYSSGRENPKVEIDYTLRKNLKKPPKANPGFVIYHTNYSMVAEPYIDDIKKA